MEAKLIALSIAVPSHDLDRIGTPMDTQTGAVPDHFLSPPHSLILSPFARTNPGKHEYVAVESTTTPVRSTLPFVGESKFPHFTAV